MANSVEMQELSARLSRLEAEVTELRIEVVRLGGGQQPQLSAKAPPPQLPTKAPPPQPMGQSPPPLQQPQQPPSLQQPMPPSGPPPWQQPQQLQQQHHASADSGTGASAASPPPQLQQQHHASADSGTDASVASRGQQGPCLVAGPVERPPPEHTYSQGCWFCHQKRLLSAPSADTERRSTNHMK